MKALSFPHLESLDAPVTSRQHIYNEFFRRHTSLKRSHLSQRWGELVDLHELTADLPDLEEMILESIIGIYHIENINRFIESHPNLKKFQFTVHDFGDRESIRNKFEKDWHIESIIETNNKDALMFEKKTQL